MRRSILACVVKRCNRKRRFMMGCAFHVQINTALFGQKWQISSHNSVKTIFVAYYYLCFTYTTMVIMIDVSSSAPCTGLSLLDILVCSCMIRSRQASHCLGDWCQLNSSDQTIKTFDRNVSLMHIQLQMLCHTERTACHLDCFPNGWMLMQLWNARMPNKWLKWLTFDYHHHHPP